MNILMLGDSAVGKTTLMVSTYGMMFYRNIQGFHIRCSSHANHEKLIQAYDAFCRGGKYPPSTSRLESYQYDFYSDDEWVINFTLTDIRGESIHDFDSSGLRRKIGESDVVMLFFNGVDVSMGYDMEDELFDLMPLLNNSFEVLEQDKMLMAVFTQMDRIQSLREVHLRRILKFCEGMSNMASRNRHLYFSLVPTACAPSCMMNLDYMMVMLMRFGFSLEVDQRYNMLIQEKNSIERQYGDGLMESILDFFGLNADRNNARRRFQELSPKIDYYNNTMLPKLQGMVDFLNQYNLFSSYSVKSGADPFTPF